MTWEVRQAPNDPNAWDVYDGAGKVAHLPWCSKANAHLIAAAPDLLLACRIAMEDAIKVRDFLASIALGSEPPKDDEEFPGMKLLREVIAKAEGR